MFLALAVAGAKMMSAIPEKIVLRSTTKISLNDRFVNETDLYNMMPVTYSRLFQLISQWHSLGLNFLLVERDWTVAF